MASESRGRARGGYRPTSLRMRAGGGAPDDDVDPGLVHLRDADLLERLRGLLVASGSGSEGGAAAPVLEELERRLDESDSRIRASDVAADTMQARINMLKRSVTAGKEEVRRATETSTRLREELGVQKRAAAGVKASHKVKLEAVEQRALAAEAQFRRASESEALLQSKIQELELKATTVEAKHRAETEVLESRAAKAVAELKEEITTRRTTAMNFQVRLEATITEAKETAAILDDEIRTLQRRVAELQGNLDDEISRRDRMAIEFQNRIDDIVSETKKRTSDEASKRERMALECHKHLDANKNISTGECATKKDEAGLLISTIHAGKQKVADMDTEIRCSVTELEDTLHHGIEEDNRIIAELEERIAKTRAMMEANENHDPDGQQLAPSPLGGNPSHTSEHRDTIDLTSDEDV